MEIELLVVDGPCRDLKKTFTIPPSIAIGRDAAFSLEKDPWVSKLHAEISLSPMGEVMLEDCRSDVGTFIEDRKVRHTSLHSGVLICVGISKLKVCWETTGSTTQHQGKKERSRVAVLAGTGIALFIVFTAMLWGPSSEEKPSGMSYTEALAARNSGNLERAVDILQGRDLDSISAQDREDAMSLLMECRSLAPRFKRAYQFEEVLRLESALDEWRILVEESGLAPDDPLRTWIQTNRIRRLEKKISNLGAHHATAPE